MQQNDKNVSFNDWMLEKLEQLREARGAAKKPILKEILDDEEGFKFIRLVMDPEVVLRQTLSPDLKTPMGMFGGARWNFTNVADVKTNIVPLLHEITVLAYTGQTTGKQGETIFRTLYTLTPNKYHPLIDVFLLRELKAGTGAKTVNAVVPGTINMYGYQRCEAGSEALFNDMLAKSPRGVVYCQKKEDALFLNAIKDFDGSVRFYTREGNELVSQTMKPVELDMASVPAYRVVIGECLVFENGELMGRQSGNGKINSIIQTGVDLGPEYKVKFIVWDFINLDVFREASNRSTTEKMIKESSFSMMNTLAYPTRLALLGNWFENKDNIEIVYTTPVQSFEALKKVFKDILSKGGEGVVAKSESFFWFDGTTKDMLKFKAIIESDFEMTEIKMGDPNGKYHDTVGSVVFETSCGKMKFSCSGLTDDQRKQIKDNPEAWLNGIYAVRFNEISQNQDEPDKYAVSFPRIISERRADKKVADTLEDVQNAVSKFIEDL